MDDVAYPSDLPKRREKPAIEHEFRSPAETLVGFTLMHCVEMEGGRLLEMWFCLGEGVVFRECIRDEPRGWVPYTQSSVVALGNAWKNNPAPDIVALDLAPAVQKILE
jgi:hypothetical protein